VSFFPNARNWFRDGCCILGFSFPVILLVYWQLSIICQLKWDESDSLSCWKVKISVLIWSASGFFSSIAEREMGTSRHYSSGHAHLSLVGRLACW